MQKVLELFLLGWLNKIGGMIIYILIFLSIYSTILFFAVKMEILTTAMISESKTYSFIKPLGPGLIELMGSIIPFFKGLFIQLEHYFGK